MTRIQLAAVKLIAIVSLLCGSIHMAAAQEQSSYHQTRRVVLDALSTPAAFCNIEDPESDREFFHDIRLDLQELRFSGRVQTKGWHAEDLSEALTISFADVAKISSGVSENSCGRGGTRLFEVEVETRSRRPFRRITFYFVNEEVGTQFEQALSWFESNSAELQARHAKSIEQFPAAAATWRATLAKSTMPAEAHVHEVLAKNAVEEKNFDKAIDEFEVALDIFPTWPEGQFNVALICSETGDYECAIEHMQNYLELVPDAPNAQAAKDNLIIWKDKLAQSQAQAAPPAVQAAASKTRK